MITVAGGATRNARRTATIAREKHMSGIWRTWNQGTSYPMINNLSVGDKMVESWILGYYRDNLDRVKHCPVCGSERIRLPNDLWEWICSDCGCWFAVK